MNPNIALEVGVSNNVYWLLEVNIKPGKIENFKTLIDDMVSSTKEESGTLNYELALSSDQATCHLYERYVDSAATMVHLGNFGAKFAERFMAIVEPTRFVVFGSPDDAVKRALEAFGPTYMTPLAGFAR